MHWFMLQCGQDPKTCACKRGAVCNNPVSDCLRYEKLMADVVTDRTRDFDEIEEDVYGQDN